MTVLPVDETCAAIVYKALDLKGFFPELTAYELAKLFPHSALELHDAQSPILQQGDTSRDLYVVRSGEVAVSQSFGSAGAQVSRLGPGDIFGEIALVKGGARTATITAETDAQVFRLAFADVQYLLKNNEALGEHLEILVTARLG